MRFSRLAVGLSLGCGVARGAKPWPETDRSEISYITRPDLKPQRLKVTTYKPDLVTPGHFFLSPYGRDRDSTTTHAFIPGQTGPHIYDGQGDLIWSGAYEYDQRSSYNLDVATYHGEQVLTFSVRKIGDKADVRSQQCTGVIMDSSYNVVKEVRASNGNSDFNMHEFNLVDDGKYALVVLVRMKTITKPNGQEQKIENNGFQAIEVATGKTVFEWYANDHVPITWIWKDPYHINAVDRTPDGNYLVSIRHLSTIYLVNGTDGSIIWQLGKENSSFKQLNGFNFRFQHHVRYHGGNDTHTTISFLDNNSWEGEMHPAGKDSAAMLVSLSTATTPMTATLLQAWKRPDNRNAYRRGSTQVLPNGHAVVSWGEQGYISEFTWDNELVQEVKYQENRFDDYRAYKLNFTGFSHEEIALVSHVSGASAESIVTAMYVSWNGATQVKGWEFYRAQGDSKPVLLGYQPRTGFETAFTIPGFHAKVYAQAIRLDGTPMKKSPVRATIPPSHFSDHQHDILDSWIKQSQEKLDTSNADANTNQPASSNTDISTALSYGLSGIAGLVLGIVGTWIAFCLARRRQNRTVAWRRVGTTADDDADGLDDLEDELEQAETEEEVAEKSGGPEESGRPLLSDRGTHS